MTTYEHTNLQELLPAYLEQSLGQEEKDSVERHLTSCPECRAELALLSAMAAEPVPDPGEAFWAVFPGKVYREIEQQQKRKPGGIFDLLSPFRLAPWAWTTAAAVVLALTVSAGYLLRPAPLRTAGKQLPDAGGVYVDLLDSEQVRISELSEPEIRSLDSWANKELTSLALRQGAAEMFLNAPEGAIDDRLSEMNKRELEHLSRLLDTENEEDGT